MDGDSCFTCFAFILLIAILSWGLGNVIKREHKEVILQTEIQKEKEKVTERRHKEILEAIRSLKNE